MIQCYHIRRNRAFLPKNGYSIKTLTLSTSLTKYWKLVRGHLEDSDHRFLLAQIGSHPVGCIVPVPELNV